MKMKKKTLFLLENISFSYDPRSRVEATALIRNGWQVCVICPRAKGEKLFEVDEGAKVYRFPKPEFSGGKLNYLVEYPIALLFVFFISLYVLLRRGFSVIHARNPPDLFFLIGWFYRLFGKRFIYDQHDICPELYRSRFRNPSKGINRMLERLEGIQAGAADCILAVNESLKQRINRRQPKSRGKTLVLRNPPAPVSRLAYSSGGKASNQKGVVTVGYIGMMNPQDGVDVLLRAADLLINKQGRRDLRFILVGDGASRPELERMVSDLDIEKYVAFTGYLRGDDFVRALASFDIGAQPDPRSEMNEYVSSCKSMDYMSAGKPVVAFTLKETVVTCGPAALYAEADDVESFAAGISRLADDPELRRRLGTLGRRRMEEELSWERQEEQLLEAYEYVSLPRRRRGSL